MVLFQNNRRMLQGSLCLTLCCFPVLSTVAMRPLSFRNILNDERDSETPPPPHVVYKETSDEALHIDDKYFDIQELYLQQSLDHFSENNGLAVNDTLHQRYFYSDRYASPPSPGVSTYAFLCVGGEGPSLDRSVLLDSVHCSGDMIELARILHHDFKANVHLFAIEHRYYGKSYPVFASTYQRNPEYDNDFNDNDYDSPVTNKHLVYLSSRQALADLAHFVETMNAKKLSQTPSTGAAVKWVTFGGSYPGMLAAWARLKYPDHIHAAVSNSAPILPTVDFAGYNDLVAFDMHYDRVGGSNSCLQVVTDGHAEIAKALKDEEHQKVADLFNICKASSLKDKKNANMFLGDGVITIPAQGNDPDCSTSICNIDKLCDALIEERKHSTPMESLARIAQLQNSGEDGTDYDNINTTGGDCLELDWNKTLQYLASPKKAQGGGLRSWLWQTCTEFGFYQTCKSNSICPYGKGFHTIDMDFEICEKAFGVDAKRVVRSVQESTKYYGGWDLNTTRILSVNGDVDPWSVLALTNNGTASTEYESGSATRARYQHSLPTHWVKGASHHFWTHPLKGGDDQEVIDGRYIIYSQVMQWLEVNNSIYESIRADNKRNLRAIPKN